MPPLNHNTSDTLRSGHPALRAVPRAQMADSLRRGTEQPKLLLTVWRDSGCGAVN